MKINLHRNNWIQHDNAEIELAGAIKVRKRLADRFPLVGEVDIHFVPRVNSTANGSIQ
jgi:hypothetical protein